MRLRYPLFTAAMLACAGTPAMAFDEKKPDDYYVNIATVTAVYVQPHATRTFNCGYGYAVHVLNERHSLDSMVLQMRGGKVEHYEEMNTLAVSYSTDPDHKDRTIYKVANTATKLTSKSCLPAPHQRLADCRKPDTDNQSEAGAIIGMRGDINTFCEKLIEFHRDDLQRNNKHTALTDARGDMMLTINGNKLADILAPEPIKKPAIQKSLQRMP